MTDKKLSKATSLKNQIKEINHALYELREENQGVLRTLRLVFNTREQKHMAYVFEKNDLHGIDIPFDADLVKCVRKFYENKLEELKMEYEEL